MIVRGTTPYHSFVLPLQVEDISYLYITYLQNGEVILDKNLSSGEIIVENVVDELENASMENLENEEAEHYCQATVHLTQEDTLKFTFYPAAIKNIAVIQLRILGVNGEAYASEPVRERIFGVLKDGVIPEE